MIRLSLGPQGAKVVECRLPAVAGLLMQLAPAHVPQAVRRLHTICREAQGLAAELALAAAQGQSLPDDHARTLAMRAAAEAFRETGLRLCLDWPLLIDEPPALATARALMALPPDSDRLSDWLFDLIDSGLPGRILGAAPEAVAPRLEARLAVLADQPLRMASWASGAPLPCGEQRQGEGSAQVWCARGSLRHRLRLALDNDGAPQVAQYTIDTPTERAFAPGGEAEALLAGVRSLAEAQWAMQALDPCVEWRIEETQNA